MQRPRVLVTGATGFFGPFVVAELQRCATVVTLGRQQGDVRADLADAAALQKAVTAARADWLVHLAAMARMADCERDPEAARTVNVIATEQLARQFGSRCLYVSSDLVFDGRRAPYGPDDQASPLSTYGHSKAEAEQQVLAHGGRVARLPLLLGQDARGRGGTAGLREALSQGRPATLFTNEYRSPLHAVDGARGLADELFAPTGPSVVHLPGPERLSRWELGQRFCAQHGLPARLLVATECQDPLRPRDVSLRGAWLPPRDLLAMLADC